MYDAATVLLREYWRATGWNDQSSYLNLSKASDGVFARLLLTNTSSS